MCLLLNSFLQLAYLLLEIYYRFWSEIFLIMLNLIMTLGLHELMGTISDLIGYANYFFGMSNLIEKCCHTKLYNIFHYFYENENSSQVCVVQNLSSASKL